MNLNDIPLNELLKMAAEELDSGTLLNLVKEINRRYAEQDRELSFEIFSGPPEDKNAIWLERVMGLAAANERMRQIAADEPGLYFVFHSRSRKILAQFDNTPAKPKTKEPPRSNTV